MFWKESLRKTSRHKTAGTRCQRHSKMGNVSKLILWYLFTFWLCFLYDIFCLVCGDFYFLSWENFTSNYRKFIKNVLKYSLFQMTRSWIKRAPHSEVSCTTLREHAKTARTTRFFPVLYLLPPPLHFFCLPLTDCRLRYFLCLFLYRLMVRDLVHKRPSDTPAQFTTCILLHVPRFHGVTNHSH